MTTATLKDIGESLKGKRVEMNLSLREIENATSIRATHLQAIEEGDLSKLISHIYAQGFVKQYATFLGVDGEKLVTDNPELFAGDSKQEFAYGIGTLEARGNQAAGVGGLPSASIMITFGAILALAWMLARYLDVI